MRLLNLRKFKEWVTEKVTIDSDTHLVGGYFARLDGSGEIQAYIEDAKLPEVYNRIIDVNTERFGHVTSYKAHATSVHFYPLLNPEKTEIIATANHVTFKLLKATND